MRISFHGATKQVTGSAHLVEINNRRILLDCGLFESDRFNPESPNRQFDFDPASLDAVVVSHAHNDHIGRLPVLIRHGFKGPIYTTPATADILNIMLRDSARIQREDARNAQLRNPDSEPLSPLFELSDVEWVIERLVRLPYEQPAELLPGITLTYHDAGHILGSAMVQFDFKEGDDRRRFLFTGDLGRRDMGMLHNPTVVKDIDVLVSESTYGAKELDVYDTLLKQLHAIVLRAIRLQSKIIIPAFSLGRTQKMIHSFLELFHAHRVKPVPIYVDSPLATRLTEVHRDHPSCYTPESIKLLESDGALFNAPELHFCPTWDDSRRLNYLNGPLIIVASSGMCEAGRIRHHLRHAVEDPDNAIVIVSYQAEKTLGRKIAEGAERIQIMDRWHDLNCAVYVLDGFSGHADRNDFAWWYEQTGGNIQSAFLVHGEPESMEALSPLLQPYVQNPVVIPEKGQSFDV